jgi:hypothetical protein
MKHPSLLFLPRVREVCQVRQPTLSGRGTPYMSRLALARDQATYVACAHAAVQRMSWSNQR